MPREKEVREYKKPPIVVSLTSCRNHFRREQEEEEGEEQKEEEGEK